MFSTTQYIDVDALESTDSVEKNEKPMEEEKDESPMEEEKEEKDESPMKEESNIEDKHPLKEINTEEEGEGMRLKRGNTTYGEVYEGRTLSLDDVEESRKEYIKFIDDLADNWPYESIAKPVKAIHQVYKKRFDDAMESYFRARWKQHLDSFGRYFIEYQILMTVIRLLWLTYLTVQKAYFTQKEKIKKYEEDKKSDQYINPYEPNSDVVEKLNNEIEQYEEKIRELELELSKKNEEISNLQLKLDFICYSPEVESMMYSTSLNHSKPPKTPKTFK